MVKPTSKAWIDPLVNYLKHLGVKFNFNTRLEKINIDENNPKK